jgi:hypothetical protein
LEFRELLAILAVYGRVALLFKRLADIIAGLPLFECIVKLESISMIGGTHHVKRTTVAARATSGRGIGFSIARLWALKLL